MADEEANSVGSPVKTSVKLRYSTFTETISNQKDVSKESISLQEAFRIYREAKQVRFATFVL